MTIILLIEYFGYYANPSFIFLVVSYHLPYKNPQKIIELMNDKRD